MDFGYLVVAGALIAALELLVCLAIGKWKNQDTEKEKEERRQKNTN